MNYSISTLPTVEACDYLLVDGRRLLTDLQHKVYGLTRRHDDAGDNSNEIEKDIVATTAQIAAYEAFLPTLPDGKIKTGMEKELVNLKHKLFLLTNRSENYGIITAVELELDVNRVEREIAETTVYVGLLEARKVAIIAAGND